MSLTLGSGTEFKLQWGHGGDSLEKTLEQHEKTSHSGHEHWAHGHTDHHHSAHAAAEGAPCCSMNAGAAPATDTSLAFKDPV